MKLKDVLASEEQRNRAFPVTAEINFMAHAAVSPLPQAALRAFEHFLEQASKNHQESGSIPASVDDARATAARLLGCRRDEVALLGPTSLGLNLVADGLDWSGGDEVVYYGEDYPANVYPWTKLRTRGVRAVGLSPGFPGEITWRTVEKALTPRTRLVALASCHFLSGYRIDIDGIGRRLRERGILFCVDGIQSLGAFPLSVRYVDFLSADSHKWLLGPLGAGIFFVRYDLQEKLRPSFLGAGNVKSPDFVAQEEIHLLEGARRYEPGALNVPGIVGMLGAMRMLLDVGIEEIAERILLLRGRIIEGAGRLGYRLYAGNDSDESSWDGENASGIITISHPDTGADRILERLRRDGIALSRRRNRRGETFLRISPHFYNTFEEVERLLSALAT